MPVIYYPASLIHYQQLVNRPEHIRRGLVHVSNDQLAFQRLSFEQRNNLFGICRGKSGGWLIHKQYRRFPDQFECYIQPLALPAGMVIVVSGALYFADRDMKTADNYFRGFPALWNAAAFYLFLLKPTPLLAGVTIVLLAALTFAPFKFLHPMRVTRLRAINIAVMILWAILALIALWHDLDPGPWVSGSLVVIGLYFISVGLTEKR
jgi:hypothetical protein